MHLMPLNGTLKVVKWGLPWWSSGSLGGLHSEESACNAEDLGSIPGSGRTPG